MRNLEVAFFRADSTCETTFASIFLFLETVGLLDWRALYAIQYNIIQYDSAQHNSTQNNTIQCTIQYAFFGF